MITGETMTYAVTELAVSESPFAQLFQPIKPPVSALFVASRNLADLMSRPRVAVVGSRKVSAYGRAVTAQFAGELARQGIVIVSGLAYGVDAIAHQAALDAGGLTLAVLPGPIEHIYPQAHDGLARRIVQGGGALISEYPAARRIAYKNQFIERNRIVSGIADVLLITEAAVNSGTMHTARFALEQGKDVLAIPGNITSPMSAGTNNLIKSGAAPATCTDDILSVLGLQPQAATRATGSTPHEQLILDLLNDDMTDGGELLARSALPVADFNHAMTMMELTGKIKALGANQWRIF